MMGILKLNYRCKYPDYKKIFSKKIKIVKPPEKKCRALFLLLRKRAF